MKLQALQENTLEQAGQDNLVISVEDDIYVISDVPRITWDQYEELADASFWDKEDESWMLVSVEMTPENLSDWEDLYGVNDTGEWYDKSAYGKYLAGEDGKLKHQRFKVVTWNEFVTATLSKHSADDFDE